MYTLNFVLYMNAQKCTIVIAATKSKDPRRPAHCGKIPVTREENSQWNPNKIAHGKSQRVL